MAVHWESVTGAEPQDGPGEDANKLVAALIGGKEGWSHADTSSFWSKPIATFA
jgi:hypothetical protein